MQNGRDTDIISGNKLKQKIMIKITQFVKEIGTVNRYSLLGRLKSDCEYFLGYGNRFERCLWAGNVSDHIWCMKVLYYLLPINGKPEWLSMTDILNYEKQMKSSI